MTARPFDLWPAVPSSLQTVLPNVAWSRERLHALVLPSSELAIDDLRWQLDLPWWRPGPSDHHFSLRPNEVRREPERFGRHWRRTLDADLRFPLHLLQRDRLIVLDGLHRLLKADVRGSRSIAIHVVTPELFAEQVVELEQCDDPLDTDLDR